MDKVREEFEKWAKQLFKLDVEDLGSILIMKLNELGQYGKLHENLLLYNYLKTAKNALTVSELKEQLDKEGIKYDF